MARSIALCVALLLSCEVYAQTPPARPPTDFPEADTPLWSLLNAGRSAAAASRALIERPESASTFLLLASREQADAALDVLEAIVARRPAELREAMTALSGRTWSLADEATGRRARLSAIVRDVRTKLPSLHREDAAWVEHSLLNIESFLERTGSRDRIPRLRRIQELYSGTEAARLLSVDLAGAQLPMQRRVDALEAFARAHPGTVEGAKALYQAGFDLAVNLPERKQGEEPSARLAKVAAIARDLESGAWPASEWVTRGAFLVKEFSTYQPRHSPDGIKAMLGIYADLVSARFTGDDTLNYLITTKMPDLLRAAGDTSLAGMEPFFERWERETGQRAALRFVRAAMFLRSADTRTPDGASSKDYYAWQDRALTAFTQLAAEGTGPHHRKALATLASVHFRERRFAEAAAIYQRYIDAFPQSEWTWAARLRLGQSLEEIGNRAAASAAYQRAASEPDNVPAQVLGFVNAARMQHVLGRYAEALRTYRAAQQAWNPAYATGYLGSSALTSYVTGPPLKSAAAITNASLSAAVARLEAATASAEGALLEQGRGLLEYERWKEASALFDRFLASHPRSALAAEARYRKHVAELQQALELADVQSAAPQRDAALAALERISSGGWDPAVGIARIARACLLLSAGDPAAAEAAMREALTEWHARQTPPPGITPLQGIEEDVAEIRKLAFRPAGGDPYTRERRWEAFPKPVLPPFVTVKPDVPVTLPGGRLLNVRAFRAAADVPPVLFVDDEQIALLAGVVAGIGGTRTRQPSQVMEVPNQPVGDSMTIVNLWNRFFNAVPGHWGGWMFESPPTVTRIEFLNAERTKASAFVTIRYEGATLMMEKIAGVWTVTGIVNRWIT